MKPHKLDMTLMFVMGAFSFLSGVYLLTLEDFNEKLEFNDHNMGIFFVVTGLALLMMFIYNLLKIRGKLF